MPIRIRIRNRSYPKFYTCWKIRKFILPFYVSISASFHCFTFLFSITDFKIFNILDSILKGFLDKKIFFSLTFFGCNRYGSGLAGPWMPIRVWIRRNDADPGPDPPKWCRSDRIRIQNPAWNIVQFRCLTRWVRCRLWTVSVVWQYGASLRKSARQFSDVTRRCLSMLSGHLILRYKVHYLYTEYTLQSLSPHPYILSHTSYPAPGTSFLFAPSDTYLFIFFLTILLQNKPNSVALQ